MNKSFILFILLILIATTQAAPPTLYKEVYADAGSPLKGKVFVSDDATGISTYEQNGLIIVSSDIHYEDITLKFKATAINAVFGYTPKSIEWKHKNDAGEIDATGIVNLGEPDAQGNYILYNVSLSTLIIGGVTSTVTLECTGISNLGWCNLSYPVNAIENITATITGLTNTWSVNGYNWNNRITFTENTTTAYYDNQIILNQTTLPLTETQFNNVELDANGVPIFNITYSNGTNINFHVDAWWNYTDYDIRINASADVGDSTKFLYSAGNPTLISGSNGLLTNKFNEDWSVNISTVKYDISGSSTIENGELNLTGDGSWTTHIQTLQSFSKEIIIEMDVRSNDSDIEAILGWSNDNTNSIAFYPKSSDSTLNARYENTPFGGIPQTTDPHRFKLIVKPTQGYAWYVNGTLLYENAIGTHDNRKITLATYNYDSPIFIDNIKVLSYLEDLPTFTMGADETLISSMYFSVTDHTNSETKITNDSSLILNSTVTNNIPVQYTQFTTNNTGIFNVSLSYQVLDNYTQIQKHCIYGVCIYNNTVSFNGIYDNVNITVNKVYNESSNYFDNFTMITNDENYSGVTENNTAYVIHSNGTNASQPYFYNFTHDGLPQPPLFRPNNLTILTSFTGTLNNTFLNDSVEIVATETTGTPSRLNFTFNLSNTVHTGINYLLRFYGYYDGNPAHETHAFVKYCDNETFVEISNATYFINDANDNYSRIFPFTGNQYRCSNGSMVVKLEHIQTTSPNHYLHVNLLNVEIFPTLPKPTISGTTVVCGADDAFGCANLNSTSDDTYSLYHWYWRLNGSSTWNSSSNTTVNGTQIELTKGLTYDFRLYASNGYDFISEYSESITITMATGDPQLDILIANQILILQQLNETQTQNAAIQAQNETILEATSALWGSGILGAILVIGWLKKSMKV